MNILILHAHTANRGDEAAVKAMVDEILIERPDANITICINGNTFYPNMPKNVTQISRVPKLHSKTSLVAFYIFCYTNGKICLTKEIKEFKNIVLNSDLILHAPGGPSIGDIYYNVEYLYLIRLNLIRKLGKKYMFYAPSMGPFKNEGHNKLRKEVLLGAERIVLRDPISVGYLREFIPDVEIIQALDSALQHDVDVNNNEEKLKNYKELIDFLSKYEKCIGITITDLKWHPKHKNTSSIDVIPKVFKKFIAKKVEEGYGIVFVPQLYGSSDDTKIMNEYMLSEGTFMVDAFSEKYDTYFQQYLIGKLYAVVGMRYHSNIFSAKMNTPFISVSYEQKMKGFMEIMGLSEYCIDISDLSIEQLDKKFDILIKNYEEYQEKLKELHLKMKQESRKTTEIALNILEGK